MPALMSFDDDFFVTLRDSEEDNVSLLNWAFEVDKGAKGLRTGCHLRLVLISFYLGPMEVAFRPFRGQSHVPYLPTRSLGVQDILAMHQVLLERLGD